MKSAKLIDLPRFLDERGNLSFLENFQQIPFEIRRVHWIYDVPGGERRGGIAYKQTEEFIIAMSGSFDVIVDDGKGKQVYSLNRSYKGVYIPAGVWRTIDNFSTNAVAVIAASTFYDSSDGIRDYQEFLSYSKAVPSPNSIVPTIKTEIIKKQFSVYDCGIISLDRHHSQRKGDISVVENGITIPFDTKRIYYLYDVPGGESRGGHAHKDLHQLIIAASGAFTVTLDDGNVRRSFTLNRPYQGLLVRPGIWRTLDDFSSGSVCLVLASELYNPDDYIRDYNGFIEFIKI